MKFGIITYLSVAAFLNVSFVHAQDAEILSTCSLAAKQTVTKTGNEKAVDFEKRETTLYQNFIVDGFERLTFDGKLYKRPIPEEQIYYEDTLWLPATLHLYKDAKGNSAVSISKIDAYQSVETVFIDVELWHCKVSKSRPETSVEQRKAISYWMKRGQAYQEYLQKLEEIGEFKY